MLHHLIPAIQGAQRIAVKIACGAAHGHTRLDARPPAPRRLAPDGDRGRLALVDSAIPGATLPRGTTSASSVRSTIASR